MKYKEKVRLAKEMIYRDETLSVGVRLDGGKRFPLTRLFSESPSGSVDRVSGEIRGQWSLAGPLVALSSQEKTMWKDVSAIGS